jgi:hypothetical protein
MLLRHAALALFLVTPCSRKHPAAADATADATATPTPTATATATSTSTSTPTSTSTSTSTSNPTATPTPTADATAPSQPLPKVKVENIGMHVGGGPYDEPTKEPIKRSVAPHFDDFKRCYALVSPKSAGDFGIDLLLQSEGGRAKTSHPRSQLRGEGFVTCMTQAFEQIDFLPLKTGTTTVSYSLRFTPR